MKGDDGWRPQGVWEFFKNEPLFIHPRHLVGEDDLEMVRLWSRCQGGLGGAGPLPEAGGVLDQAAISLAALDVISAAMADLDERFGDREG